MEITRKREIGKSLNRSNILMVLSKSKFVENLHRELVNLGTNFQNHDIDSEDLLSSLVHMVASGKFFDVGIFDVDSFKKNTDYIAGTFRAVNPNIKLIAIIDEKEHDSISLKEFDTVVSKPISYQRFIHHIEEIYSSDLFGNKTNIDYSTLGYIDWLKMLIINREYEKGGWLGLTSLGIILVITCRRNWSRVGLLIKRGPGKATKLIGIGQLIWIGDNWPLWPLVPLGMGGLGGLNHGYQI